ncbi:three-Cys-motif partner protein TcmP [Candidatus Nitrosotenuis uzonensis]|uniref:Three-Cys-motif partner protein TcmP n=1 Tax=Candidatus Nitrosotenuis uzonensis TaxID=1407055 RepID=A0A812F4N3_9ARCH|nr:three-Cys-motif partner protein TcmP [Candidatus Nitrosotenuis uzonensis]CAE6488069.1 hypothetical protein NUZ5A_20407 [Candidatus Nitrosotenuis uzonensis]
MTRQPFDVVRDTLEYLHNSVSQFNNEKITTEKNYVWSTKKLIALYLYIEPYVKIMRKKGFKKLHYYDLFAGSGLYEIYNKKMPGTPLTPLTRIKDGYVFDEYVLADRDPQYINELKKRAKIMLGQQKSQLRIENFDFDDSIRHFFGTTYRQVTDYFQNGYLIVLDPFGFTVSWSNLLRILQSGAVDIFITFQTSQSERNKSIRHSEEKLTEVFGNEKWRDWNDHAKLYCNQIEHVIAESGRSYKTEQIFVDTDGSTSYHFIFASSADGAITPFRWIKEKIDSIDINNLKSAFAGATRKGANIDQW